MRVQAPDCGIVTSATKLCCTLGPSTRDVETISKLLVAGMQVDRVVRCSICSRQHLSCTLSALLTSYDFVSAAPRVDALPSAACLCSQVARFDFTWGTPEYHQVCNSQQTILTSTCHCHLPATQVHDPVAPFQGVCLDLATAITRNAAA